VTVRTGLVLLAAAAALALSWLAREVVLLAFVGVLIGVVFSFPVGWLSRVMPRSLAVVIVLLALIGAATLLVLVAAPQLSEQFSDLSEAAPRAVRDAERWLRERGQTPAKVGERAQQALGKAAEVAVPALLGLVEGVTAIILVIVLGAFLVHAPDAYRRGLRRLVPKDRQEVFDESWRRVGGGLRRWVGGILVSMTIMGTLAAIGLRIAGINDWLLLGILTFLGTFVPYVGAIASAVPGLLVALSQSPQHLLYAAIVYVGVHIVEGYLISPLVMRRAVEVKPALLLVGQGSLAAIFGVLGAVVATPILVCAQTLVEYLWVERAQAK
jgi:predicted PurR-regulated permease PerM